MSRSLADDLRQRSDEELHALLLARPDLVNPVAPDLSALAARASSSPSVLRAIDGLDRFSLQVLETICALGEEVDPKKVIGYTDKTAKKVIDHLRSLALIYGEPLRVPVAVREAIGNEPAGLGPVSGVNADEAMRLLDDAPLAAHAVLERLTWGPPRGVVGDIRQASEGIDWLLKQKMLMAIDKTTVVLPRELGIALRGDRIFKVIETQPPALEGSKPEKVDAFGAHAASSAVRWTEELLETWSHDPAETIRAGGLGIRELRKVADFLDVEEVCAAFVIETAYAAGLINVQGDKVLPTTFFDIWMSYDNAQRWEVLARAWVGATRLAGFVGSQSRNMAVLGPELERLYAPAMREQLLLILKDASGLAPTSESLEARLAWFMPRRGAPLRSEFVQWTLRECEWLGITSRGALTKFAHELLDGEVKSLATLIPAAIDHIMIQADLTAIAPGPLQSELSREMSLLADVESRGGATVYRFTEQSVRRGLDAGRTADEILDLLSKASKTELPQPLKYLVADVGKRHGSLRVGYAGSYIRCDDQALLTAMVSDKKVASLRLRRLAPSILVSTEEPETVVEVLAQAGYAPAAEAPDGTLMIRQMQSRRAPRRESKSEGTKLNDLLLESAIKTMRGGDKAITAIKSPKTALPKTSETMSFLQQAITDQGSLWIGLADPHGGITERIVDPIAIQRGALIAYDHTTKEEKSFPIFRITAVARVE